MRQIFSSSKDGWQVKDWRNKCIGESQTLTIFKSIVGNVSAGYLNIAWESIGGRGMGKPDSAAFLISIDHKIKLTPCSPTAIVVYFDGSQGPNFGHCSLGICPSSKLMNSENGCFGCTENQDCFRVPLDKNG